MLSFKQLVLVFMLLLMATSCGKKKNNSTQAVREIKLVEEEIDYILDNQYMSCVTAPENDSWDCPTGIARLFIFNRYEPEQSGVCTGFLVNGNTLVTNNHCVKDQTACNDTYISLYVGGNEPNLRTKCKKIIKTGYDSKFNGDPNKSIDYTIMEIDDVNWQNETFSIAANGASLGDFVTAWVVDHTGLDDEEFPNFYNSRITEFKCNVKDQDIYASIVLEDCPVIGGNSGSPVVNKNGDVVGIIWGGEVSDLDAATRLSERRAADIWGMMTDIRLFYQFII